MSNLPDSGALTPSSVPPSFPVYLRQNSATPQSSSTSLESLPSPNVKSQNGPKVSLTDILSQSFVPNVALLCSDDADSLVKEKGFEDMLDLVQRFGDRIPEKVTARDMQGTTMVYDDFGVRFTPFLSLERTEEQDRSNDVFFHVDRILHHRAEALQDYMDANDTTNANGPSQSLWQELVHLVMCALTVAPHETFLHPVACVIAISSRNQNPIDTLSALYEQGNNAATAPYIDKDYLRYYVLVHDENDDINASLSLFEKMKRHFGLHCHLLRVESEPCGPTNAEAVSCPPSKWRSVEQVSNDIANDLRDCTQFLCMSDVSALQKFIKEMVAQSIIPFMERSMAAWNDRVASSRRSMSGRFFSVGRKYFAGANKSSAKDIGLDPNTGAFPPAAPEAQLRKLADYAFMLRDWRLAHSTYDILRREVDNEKAWRYYAGANEMAAISILLTSQQISAKTHKEILEQQLENAFYTYVNRCDSPFSALRCNLFAADILCSRGAMAADDAAKLAIQALVLSSQSIVRSAIISERISFFYAVRQGISVGTCGSRRRKQALWSLIAFKAWFLADMSSIGYRNLELASNVYRTTNWSFIQESTDHMFANTMGILGNGDNSKDTPSMDRVEDEIM